LAARPTEEVSLFRGVSARALFVLGALLCSAAERPALAQDCPCPSPTPPPPPWRVSLGGGLSVTGGNTETSSYNVSVEAQYDPHTRNVVRGSGLYLRTSQDGVASANRTLVTGRDEYTPSGRAFVFGNVEYQRDRFKGVDHVVAPQLGVGFKIVENPKILCALDGGLGAAIEKLVGEDATTRLAVNASNRVEWKASGSTTVFQKANALWKAADFADAYYHAETGITTGLAKRLEVKFAFVDDYKTKPPSPALKKNDTSFLASLVFRL
jgi:putative salt-induced outer membrane protein